VAALDPAVSTLAFTNTRNQAEAAASQLASRYACPEMEDGLALHTAPSTAGEREKHQGGPSRRDDPLGGLYQFPGSGGGLPSRWSGWFADRLAKNLARLLQRGRRSAPQPGAPPGCCSCPPTPWSCWSCAPLRRGGTQAGGKRGGPLWPRSMCCCRHLTSLACGPGFRARAGAEAVSQRLELPPPR